MAPPRAYSRRDSSFQLLGVRMMNNLLMRMSTMYQTLWILPPIRANGSNMNMEFGLVETPGFAGAGTVRIRHRHGSNIPIFQSRFSGQKKGQA